jgi:hypothetical protein
MRRREKANGEERVGWDINEDLLDCTVHSQLYYHSSL